MSRLLTSLLVMLLGVWPVRSGARAGSLRPRIGRRFPSRRGTDEAQEPIEAPDRARARTFGVHHWPGHVAFSAGERRTVVRGRWRLTVDPVQRAQPLGAAGVLSLDAAYPEVWETQLEALLTLQVPGARLAIVGADADGWRVLEVRAPTTPETVVQMDGTAIARLFDATVGEMRVELRVTA